MRKTELCFEKHCKLKGWLLVKIKGRINMSEHTQITHRMKEKRKLEAVIAV